jgi:hypothetical protein
VEKLRRQPPIAWWWAALRPRAQPADLENRLSLALSDNRACILTVRQAPAGSTLRIATQIIQHGAKISCAEALLPVHQFWRPAAADAGARRILMLTLADLDTA